MSFSVSKDIRFLFKFAVTEASSTRHDFIVSRWIHVEV